MIAELVQDVLPRRREDVAPFLQRVAVWFTVTKGVQVTKRVVIDDIIATKIVGGLVAAGRRRKTRKQRRDAKLKELRSQLRRGNNSLRGVDDGTPGGGADGVSLGTSPMGRRAREFGVADRHADADDIENDARWLSGEYDERVPITKEEEVAAAALDEVAMALAMEGSNGESQRLAGMAVKVAALSPPKRSFGSQFTDSSAY